MYSNDSKCCQCAAWVFAISYLLIRNTYLPALKPLPQLLAVLTFLQGLHLTFMVYLLTKAAVHARRRVT